MKNEEPLDRPIEEKKSIPWTFDFSPKKLSFTINVLQKLVKTKVFSTFSCKGLI